MENEEKALSEYSMPELQELITVAYKSWREETDLNKKKIKRKYLITIKDYYNKRAGFKAYKDTL